jgi:hypothetical protein
MRTLRAKFKVDHVTHSEWDESVVLSAVSGSNDQDDEENNQFSEATPSADLEMTVSNPSARGFFIPGKAYYLDFQEAPE